MKKLLTVLLVLTVLALMSVPALAANESGGSTAVTYVVASNYSILIPEGVTLNATTGIGTLDFKLLSDSIIPADKDIEFTITGATNYSDGFRLKNNVGNNIYLAYTIKDAADANVVKDTAFLTATAAEANEGKTVSLTFTPDEVRSAGTYSDTLTITVSLVDANS